MESVVCVCVWLCVWCTGLAIDQEMRSCDISYVLIGLSLSLQGRFLWELHLQPHGARLSAGHPEGEL